MNNFVIAVVSLLVISDSAVAQQSCKVCVSDRLAGAKEKVLAAAAIGAIGLAPTTAGAVCGAVLGAVGAAVGTLIEVSTCEKTCLDEAKGKSDPAKANCETLMMKVKR